MDTSMEHLTTLTLPAPAKINLFLHILGQRADGYHNLQTAFQFLEFSDELTFTLRDDHHIILHSSFDDIPTEQNIIFKAAKWLQDYSRTKQGVDIWVEKKIPIGGGLGGGSSNAATTLVALNQLWQLQISNHALCQLGLQLGADVPIFIYGYAAFAEGVGEKLMPITPPEPWYLITIPKVCISTAQVFNDPELPRDTAPISLTQLDTVQTHNDCLVVVEKQHAEIKELLALLNQFSPTKLTGTGACLFTPVESKQHGSEIANHLTEQTNYIITKGCNQSPLYRQLKKQTPTSI